MKVKIVEAKHPRKGSEYAVQILSDDDKYLLCARPYTPYQAEAQIVAQAFEVFIANGGEKAITEAVEKLP